MSAFVISIRKVFFSFPNTCVSSGCRNHVQRPGMNTGLIFKLRHNFSTLVHVCTPAQSITNITWLSGSSSRTLACIRRTHCLIHSEEFQPLVRCHASSGAPVSDHNCCIFIGGVSLFLCFGNSTCGKSFCIASFPQMSPSSEHVIPRRLLQSPDIPLSCALCDWMCTPCFQLCILDIDVSSMFTTMTFLCFILTSRTHLTHLKYRITCSR